MNMPAENAPSTSMLRASVRVLLFLALVLLMFLPVLGAWALTCDGARSRLVRLFYDLSRRICGVRLKIVGTASDIRPLMLVANHTSYLDIFVLGSILPISFTPKLEIRSWPVIGFFCVLADCVFIERKPTDIQRAQSEMAEKLKAGKALVLFPEGTTGDGFTVKPFKSGFLSLAEAQDLPLQSVSLAYTHIGTTPLSPATRELVAWIGEASLITHLVRLLSFRYIQVTATFYGVEHIANHADRKALAKTCETVITQGLHETLEAAGVVG